MTCLLRALACSRRARKWAASPRPYVPSRSASPLRSAMSAASTSSPELPSPSGSTTTSRAHTSQRCPSSARDPRRPPVSEPRHTNRLARETSPYLLQHRHNPVDWYPWGPEALERARAEDKPVLLSVGYSACHWCHVMERESFENEAIAALMNELFVNIKVDREERPDVDQIYMQAVQAMTGHGGWPMTVFLTPDGVPFYGGTYFPPEDRRGMPAFPRLLQGVAEAYRGRRSEVVQAGRQLLEQMRQSERLRSSTSLLTDAVLLSAYQSMAAEFDSREGGLERAPKFPQPMNWEFLLRCWKRSGSVQALDMVDLTLTKMARGGMYDQIGGGFHRYSVDGQWLVPHFEKMLYDNALLEPPYLHAWLLTREERYRVVAEQTLDYMVRELRLPSGGFASSQDADTDGVEGLTYTWTAEEGAPAELLQPFEHGRSILRGELDDETRARLLAIRDEC